MKKIYLLIILGSFSFFELYSQNGIIGPGFGTNNWFKTDNFNGSAGTSRIGTFTANGTGNQYFRTVINWDGIFNQYTITSGSDVLVNPENKLKPNDGPTTSGAMYLDVSSTSDNYIFKTRDGGTSPSFDMIIFQVQGTVQTVSSVTKDKDPVYRGQTVTVTANLSGSLSSGQGVYLRYTDNGFSTSTIVEMSGSGTTYTADIPSSTNSSAAGISYYVFTSGDDLTIDHADADWYTINLNNNGGSNYSYTVNSSFISALAGDWGTAATWVDGVPISGASVVIDHNVTLNQAATVSSLTINSGKELNGGSSTLTISGSGTLTNNGTFTAGTGTVSFAGAGTVSGTVVFNDVDIAGGVNFGSSSTIDGTLTINAGGFVNTNAPTYGTGSTLQYNTVNVFSRNLEWSNSTGAGFPYNVQISNNSSLNLGANSGTNVERLISNDLIIDEGSSLFLDYGEDDMTKSLVVNGDVTVNGTISLSNEIGGDLKLKGNLTFGENSTFNANERAIFFNGETTQTVQATSASTYTIAYIIVGETGGDATTLQLVGGDIIANAPQGGNAITFSNATDKIDLNGNKISIGTADVTSTISGSGSFIGSTTSKIEILGNGEITLNLDQTIPGTTNALGTLTINRPTGVVTIGTAATIPAAGVWTIKPESELTISGALINNAGNDGLVIESNSSATGSLIHSSNDIASTSNRYMAGTEIWRLVSSPVDNQVIIDVDNWTPTGSYEGGHGYDFYAYQESSATWLNQKVGANSITSFTPGQGYLVSFQEENPTKSFEGELNNGDVPISVSKTGTGDYAGANLIGNPYPSGIDWNDADRSLFSDDFAYVYDRESNPGHPTYEGYRLVDGTQPDAYIAPHQGFFVIKKDAGSSDFTFTNAMRGHGGTFTKAPANFSGLKLKVSNGSYYDIATININETASFDRDRMDAIKFYSNNANMPNFYSISKDSKQLAINTIPSIQIEEPIVIGITVPANGAYEISLNEQGADFADKVIYLEDLLTGIRHNLTADGIYSYSASTSDNPNRFLLHFGVVGIGEQDQASTLQAYMVDNRLYVNNSLEQAQLAVYDLQGRLVAAQSLNTAGLQSLPLELPAGVYIVRLNNASESRAVKINVQ